MTPPQRSIAGQHQVSQILPRYRFGFLVLTLKRQYSVDGLRSLTADRYAVVFAGELVASGLAAFAGLVGGGVGEQRVSGGAPAGSGVAEGADDQDGLFVAGVVGGADGSVFGSGVLAAPVGDAGLAQVGEPDGVAAGFGQEVAAEAEHVRPAAQADITGMLAGAPAGVDEPFGVGAAGVGVQVDRLGSDPGRGVPGRFGALDGV